MSQNIIIDSIFDMTISEIAQNEQVQQGCSNIFSIAITKIKQLFANPKNQIPKSVFIKTS